MKALLSELRRITWVNKKSLFSTVFVVILIGIFLTAYIYGVDSLTDMISKLIINKM